MKDHTFAQRKWDKLVAATTPIIEDIQMGRASTQDLADLTSIIKCQSKLASLVFDQQMKALRVQTSTYEPRVREHLKTNNLPMDEKSIALVMEKVFQGALKDQLPSILDRVQNAIRSEEASRGAYEELKPWVSPVVKQADKTSIFSHICDSLGHINTLLNELPSNVASRIKGRMSSSPVSNQKLVSEDGEVVEIDSSLPLPPKLEGKLVTESLNEKKRKDDTTPEASKKEENQQKSFTRELLERTHLAKFFDKMVSIYTEKIASKKKGNLAREKEKKETKRKSKGFLGDLRDMMHKTVVNRVVSGMFSLYETANSRLRRIKDKITGLDWSSLVGLVLGGGFLFAKVKELWDNGQLGPMMEWAWDNVKNLASTWIGQLVDWGEEKLKVIKDWLLDWLKGETEEKAHENDVKPGEIPQPGEVTKGKGEDAKGNKVYTTQLEDDSVDKKYHTVTHNPDGSFTTSTSDYDPRVIQEGDWKGWIAHKKGLLSDIDPDSSDGTYVDYINPKTGSKTREKVFLDTGTKVREDITPKDRAMGALEELKVREYTAPKPQATPKAKQPPAQQQPLNGVKKETIKTPTPPPVKKEPLPSLPKGASYEAPKNLPKDIDDFRPIPGLKVSYSRDPNKPKVYYNPSATTPNNPVGKVKTETVPKQSSVRQPPKEVTTHPVPIASGDSLNLSGTRANGNRSDDTLGILNGRDI